jgi:hypothetical protein
MNTIWTDHLFRAVEAEYAKRRFVKRGRHKHQRSAKGVTP